MMIKCHFDACSWKQVTSVSVLYFMALTSIIGLTYYRDGNYQENLSVLSRKHDDKQHKYTYALLS